MASFLRDSKYRHTVVTLTKKEFHYEQLKVANSSISDSNPITSNSLYVAYIDSQGSGSCVAVLPLSSVGKNHIPVLAPSYQQPLIRGHSNGVSDITFSPFESDKILTCSMDSTIKLWSIPAGGLLVDSTAPVSTLTVSNSNNSSIPLREIIAHASANHIYATRGTKDVALLDMHTTNQIACTKENLFNKGDLQSLSWSYNGDILVTTSKDKVLRFLDMRCADSLVSETESHAGTRNSRSSWLGDTPYLITCGHTSTQDREYFIWDSRSMSNGPVQKERIDSSTGMMVPLYDSDTGLLILAGKGDSTVRLYEFDGCKLHAISNTPCGDQIKGATLLPKQANDVMSCEVLRLLKLTDLSIQPISYTVPRKERRKFQDDLFPPTVTGAPAATTAADWLTGSSALPIRIPIYDPTLSTKTSQSASSTSNTVGGIINDDANEGDDSATSSIVSEKRKSLAGLGSVRKYRHMYGTENPKNSTYYNIKPATGTNSDNALIACNEKYFAFPYEGSGGGPVYVSRLSSFGKVEPSCPLINGHKASVVDVAFSQFHTDMMVTSSNNCCVKVWKLPTDESIPIVSQSDNDSVVTIKANRNVVKTCVFSPTVSCMLCTASFDNVVKLFDINSDGREISTLNIEYNDCLPGQVNSISFNSDGTLFSLASKDRSIRIVDPRSSQPFILATPVATSSSSSLGRNPRAIWCNNHTIFTTSSQPSGQRVIQTYDARSMNEAVTTVSVDNGVGQLFPMYDESANVAYVAGKGDTIIRYYELGFTNDKISCDKANDFQSSRDPIAGVCLLPKSTCDVRNVEITRMLKLTTDSVIPISFKVPRADGLKVYFQDDLYQPIRSTNIADSYSVDDWLDYSKNRTFDVKMHHLKPHDMINVGEKPTVEKVSNRPSSVDFKRAIEEQEDETRKKEETFTKLSEMALQRAKYHPNTSGGAHSKRVDAALVQDSDSDRDDWDD